MKMLMKMLCCGFTAAVTLASELRPMLATDDDDDDADAEKDGRKDENCRLMLMAELRRSGCGAHADLYESKIHKCDTMLCVLTRRDACWLRQQENG